MCVTADVMLRCDMGASLARCYWVIRRRGVRVRGTPEVPGRLCPRLHTRSPPVPRLSRCRSRRITARPRAHGADSARTKKPVYLLSRPNGRTADNGRCRTENTTKPQLSDRETPPVRLQYWSTASSVATRNAATEHCTEESELNLAPPCLQR